MEDEQSPPLSEGSSENWIEDLDHWLTDQEEWLNYYTSLDTTQMNWNTLCTLHSTLQGSIDLFMHQQENWFIQLNQLSNLDERGIKLRQKWNEIIPVLILRYSELLHLIASSQNEAINLTKSSIDQGKETLASLSEDNSLNRDSCTVLKNLITELSEQMKRLETAQSVRPLQLAATPTPLGGEEEEGERGHVMILIEKEDEDDGADCPYKEVVMTVEKVGLLLLECQELYGQLEDSINTMSEEISQSDSKLMKELEEVEAWLNHVEQWVWMEPRRMFDNHGSLTRESSMQQDYFTEDDEEEHHPELFVDDTPSPNNGAIDSNSSPYVDGVFSSDSSPGLPPPVLDYEDEEREEEEEEEQKEEEERGEEEREEKREGQQDIMGQPPLPLNISLEEGEHFINFEEVFTPDSPQDRHLAYPSPSLSKPHPPVFDDEEGGESESGGSYMSSSECSRTTGEESNSLEWINHIRLFEYRLSSTEESLLQDSEGEGGDKLPYSELIQQLQLLQSSIPDQLHKKDSILANSQQLLQSAKSPDDAREIQLRLENIQSHWKDLQKRIDTRIAEMVFEMKETEFLEWLLDVKAEIDTVPKSLLLPEEMGQSLKNFKAFFDKPDQVVVGEQFLGAIKIALDQLCAVCEDEAERTPQTITTFEEAFEVISEKINQKRDELEVGVKLWEDFEIVTTPLNEWLEGVELDVQGREVYGNTLEEAQQFRTTIDSYRGLLHDKYESVKLLVSIGNDIVSMVMDGSPAHRHIDTVVRGSTQRWQDVVTLLNKVDHELSGILIKWQEYVELYEASCDFIGHVHQIAGQKPLEESHGDIQLLPKFIELQNEVKAFESNFEHLHLIRKELDSCSKVGGKESVEQEMARLESDWSNISDVTQSSLDHLWAEHVNWFRNKLITMTSLVNKGEGLLGEEFQFIKDYPLVKLLDCPAEVLLQNVKDMCSKHEDEYFSIDEELCQLQSLVETRQKTIADSSFSSHDHQYNALIKDLVGVVQSWDKVQLSSSTLSPVFQLITAQLELVLGLQKMRESVQELGGVSGYRGNIERKVEEAMLAFSETKFESLRQSGYDLDTIYRECYAALDKESLEPALRLPSNQEVIKVHQQLNNETVNLLSQTKGVMSHFLLLLDWWKEYEELDKVYWLWSKEIWPQLRELQERTDEASHDDTPQELFEIAQELQKEVTAKDTLYSSMTTTLLNIIHDFNDKHVPSEPLSKTLNELQQDWEELQKYLKNLYDQLENESNQLNEYLKRLSSFSERLNAAYSELYDECCTAISPNASQETLTRQKMKLQKFNLLMQEMSNEFVELQKAGEKWGFRHIPQEWIEEFRETSPALSDDGSGESSHASVGRQLATSEGRLAAMKRMLQDRGLDLELCEGNAAALLSSANELLSWVEESLGLSFLNEAPPGEFEKLLQNKESLEELRETFESKKHLLEKLHQLAATSKGSLSEVNLKKIETLMSQLDIAWKQMEQSVVVSTHSTEEVLAMMEAYRKKCTAYEAWLSNAEKILIEAGSIGADLKRIEEQEVILQELNSDILDHKKAPEDLKLEAHNIISMAQEGTADELEQKIQVLERRYNILSEQAAENSELCEQAKKDLQDFAVKEEEFNKMIEKVTNGFKNLTSKPKRPVGNTQETLDEHIDYCIEVECQSDSFDQLYQFGCGITLKYIPCDEFKDHLQNLFDQWNGFIEQLEERWLEIKGLQGYWIDFESRVGEFLNWVTEEAKTFSLEVTSMEGEKGVVDHMHSCKAMHDTLNNKKVSLNEISELGNILKPDDGEKPNGTKDVESRLNDINIHWMSICQLLDETLDQLSSVHEKMCLIEDITNKELEWLDQISTAAAEKVPTRGVIEVLNGEINRHKVYLEDIEEHRPFIEVVITTEAFMLEHTRKSEHAPISERIKNIVERFEELEGTEKVYVDNLVQSVPLWEEFNEYRTHLSQWVHEAEGTYNSDKLRPGNAVITERNLRNAEELNADIDEHKPKVQHLNQLMKQLSGLCTTDDCTFLTDKTNQITVHVDTLSDSTEARRQMLDTRLQSWQVFPVEEAKTVQELLDAIALEIDEEENDNEDEEEEELTGEQLMEKLKRLENLQDEQAARESNVLVIDRSADNQEIKAALAKNPDISKERNNLLQGWSNASVKLSDKVTTMRLKAEMTLQFEKLFKSCNDSLEAYQLLLCRPFPPSPCLVRIHEQWSEEETGISVDCKDNVERLVQFRDSYKDDPRIQVPKKFSDQVDVIKTTHSTLQETHSDRRHRMSTRIKDWTRYHDLLGSFSDWVTTARAEFSALSAFPSFLTEFRFLHGRFKLLEESVKEKEEEFQYLCDHFEMHLLFVKEKEKKKKE